MNQERLEELRELLNDDVDDNPYGREYGFTTESVKDLLVEELDIPRTWFGCREQGGEHCLDSNVAKKLVLRVLEEIESAEGE